MAGSFSPLFRLIRGTGTDLSRAKFATPGETPQAPAGRALAGKSGPRRAFRLGREARAVGTRVVAYAAYLLLLLFVLEFFLGCISHPSEVPAATPPAAGASVFPPNRTPSPGQRVAGVDGSTTTAGAKLPRAASDDGTDVETAPADVAAAAGQRGSAEGGPPTPAAAANLPWPTWSEDLDVLAARLWWSREMLARAEGMTREPRRVAR
jgi:hypothetical protein